MEHMAGILLSFQLQMQSLQPSVQSEQCVPIGQSKGAPSSQTNPSSWPQSWAFATILFMETRDDQEVKRSSGHFILLLLDRVIDATVDSIILFFLFFLCVFESDGRRE